MVQLLLYMWYGNDILYLNFVENFFPRYKVTLSLSKITDFIAKKFKNCAFGFAGSIN